MGLALDSIGFSKANPGSTFTAATAATGDSFTVRNFAQTAYARLIGMTRQGAAAGGIRVLSPLLHDNVRGITVQTAETPSLHMMPRQIGQRLQPQDTLTVQITGGTNETDGGVLFVAYSDLPGAAARLHTWDDIKPLVKNIKPIQVSPGSVGGSDAWVDTVITTTEDLTHANTDYAVLGYVTDAAAAAIGIKGIDTGNLRVCGPGPTATFDISEIFIAMSIQMQIPFIPVFNSANKGATFMSLFSPNAAVTADVSLICAELTQNLPN